MHTPKKPLSPPPSKIVRTDARLECPHLDRVLREKGMDLVLLADDVSAARLGRETRDADVILMCYTPITARVIAGATRLKGIVKYGVGIDAIDIEAAQARKIPVVNAPEYAEETVAEGALHPDACPRQKTAPHPPRYGKRRLGLAHGPLDGQ